MELSKECQVEYKKHLLQLIAQNYLGSESKFQTLQITPEKSSKIR